MPELPEPPEPTKTPELDDEEWWTLSEALAHLPRIGRTALTQAADAGWLDTWKTPGGHRRYRGRHVRLMARGVRAPALLASLGMPDGRDDAAEPHGGLAGTSADWTHMRGVASGSGSGLREATA
jgi:hypothetical protein